MIVTPLGQVFLPAAKVIFEGLFETRASANALPSLRIIAQIKSLIDGTANDNPLPANLPPATILEAATWYPHEQDASWHRIVGLCLRESGHLTEVLPHLQKAIDINPNFHEARSSLARWYDMTGDADKAIELELVNIALLTTQLAIPIDENLSWGSQQETKRENKDVRLKLETSYSYISRWHLQQKQQSREEEVLTYIRKAVDTDDVVGPYGLSYIKLLDKTQHPQGFEEALRILHVLHDSPDEIEHNKLTSLLYHWCIWPRREEDTWFHFTALAAKEKDELKWLVQVWEKVLEVAKTRSHIVVLRVKVALLYLYKNHVRYKTRAAELSRGVGMVASARYVGGEMDMQQLRTGLGV